MKKLVLLFTFLVCAVTAQAAITSWVAFSPLIDDSYVGGTAYLVEVPTGGATLQAMIDHIKKNGLKESAEVVADDIDSTEIASDPANTAFKEGSVSENATATYYVLLVDAERKNFLFSNGAALSDATVWSSVELPSGTSYTAQYLDRDGTAWANNGGAVGVPEPTALALLALGVAGLALRRRV